MTARFDIPTAMPEADRRVLALETHVRGTLEHVLLDLVKLRGSMINGCAFCVDVHPTDLVAAGEDPRRVHAVDPPGGSRRSSPTPSGPPWTSPMR